MNILAIIIYFLVFVIVALIGFAIMQIKLTGINVRDFWSFIEANNILDRLYCLSKKYDKLNVQEQIIFLSEAEKVFTAFDKVPNAVWEEEYSKYKQVLDTYRSIRMLRWAQAR